MNKIKNPWAIISGIISIVGLVTSTIAESRTTEVMKQEIIEELSKGNK